jgi:hypothetical protein
MDTRNSNQLYLPIANPFCFQRGISYCAMTIFNSNSLLYHHHHHHHHHKHQGLDHLARSVSTVTAALSSVSSVSQLFSFPADCSGMILKGFGVVAFFAGVRASSFCIHLSCLVCIQSAVHGVWSHLSYGH